MILWFCLGASFGCALMYWHFWHNRLIRTRREWYSDPVIREKYPEEAERALNEPDEDP